MRGLISKRKKILSDMKELRTLIKVNYEINLGCLHLLDRAKIHHRLGGSPWGMKEYPNQFKARIAFGASRGDKSLGDITPEYGAHPQRMGS